MSTTLHHALANTAASLPTDLDLLRRYQDLGIREVFSVPCSITRSWTEHALAADRRREWRFRLTSHESNLPGLAAGVYLGTGRSALVHLQNSGLPYVGEGLISMASQAVSGIPLSLLVTYRGADDRENSEPHQEIGRRTDVLVQALLGDEARVYGNRNGDGVLDDLERSVLAARAGGIGVLKLSDSGFRMTRSPAPGQGLAAAGPLQPRRRRSPPAIASRPMPRDDALGAIVDRHPNAAILVCNGYNARALRAVADQPGNFYNVGYMGGTLAMGWSLAHSRPDLEVVVIDGDQNALMSCMKDTLWHDHPANLHWYILDNQVGASVGGAPSLPLPDVMGELACVIQTLPDPQGSFVHPRVGAHGARFDAAPPAELAGRLASLTWRFRHWAEGRSADVSHPPTERTPA